MLLLQFWSISTIIDVQRKLIILVYIFSGVRLIMRVINDAWTSTDRGL